jgi:hypothetical protein
MNIQDDVLLPYTKISPMTPIRIERKLPAPGEILVQTGERVEASQRIARVPVRGEIQVVNVARILGLSDHDLSRVMVKRCGDWVEAGEIIAAREGNLPFLHKPCRSPIAGCLLAIGHGMVIIESRMDPAGNSGAESKTIDLLAFVNGRVTAIADRRSITIETIGAHIVGACGVGSEGIGVLQVVAGDPTHTLVAEDIEMGSNGAILVSKASVSPEAIKRAGEMQVKGIIVGGISSTLHDLDPTPDFPIVATEGYGNLSMSPMVFDILKQLEGREASIGRQIGEAWDGARPQIIVPLTEYQGQEYELSSGVVSTEPARVGQRVRAVRDPVLGQIGEIASIPAVPKSLPSGLYLPGAQVAFADSEGLAIEGVTVLEQGLNGVPSAGLHFVPWSNLERVVEEPIAIN